MPSVAADCVHTATPLSDLNHPLMRAQSRSPRDPQREDLTGASEEKSAIPPAELADPDSCFMQLEALNVHYKLYEPQVPVADLHIKIFSVLALLLLATTCHSYVQACDRQGAACQTLALCCYMALAVVRSCGAASPGSWPTPAAALHSPLTGQGLGWCARLARVFV